MRIDAFLNAVNITKRRAVAQDMCANKVVLINSLVVKPSKEVKAGDTVEIKYLESVKKYQVLEVPTAKTTPKSQKDKYIKEI